MNPEEWREEKLHVQVRGLSFKDSLAHSDLQPFACKDRACLRESFGYFGHGNLGVYLHGKDTC